MDKYGLISLSRYEHLDSYLDSQLQDLVKLSIASEGFDGNKRTLIHILYDKNNNPYLLFDNEDSKFVSSELKERIIRPQTIWKFDKIMSVIKFIDSGIIHKLIQKKDPLEQYKKPSN